jgi:hypothetical protein
MLLNTCVLSAQSFTARHALQLEAPSLLSLQLASMMLFTAIRTSVVASPLQYQMNTSPPILPNIYPLAVKCKGLHRHSRLRLSQKLPRPTAGTR